MRTSRVGVLVRAWVLVGLVGAAPLASPGFAQENTFGTIGAPAGTKTGDGTPAFASVAGSPEANLYTGTASTAIDIVVPPGREKLTPKVSLQYSSTGGRSAYGFGWAVATSRISRSTKNGVPTYQNAGAAADTFVLDLNGSSIELTFDAGNRYLPRIEGSFLQIGFDSTDNANYWRVIDRDGTIYTFGGPSNSRLGFDPDTSTGTFAWLLENVTDVSGNTIDYHYKDKVDAVGAEVPGGLPLSIEYGGNTGGPAGTAAPIQTQFKVEFVWETPVVQYPSKRVVSYAAGYADYGGTHLVKIVTRALSRTPPYDVVREYDLVHRLDGLCESSTFCGAGDSYYGSGTDYLTAVGLTAYGTSGDHSDDVTVPSSEFVYSPPVQSRGWATAVTSSAFWGSIPALTAPSRDDGQFFDRVNNNRKVFYEVMDLNSDGILDYLDTSSPSVRVGSIARTNLPANDDPVLSLMPEAPFNWPQIDSSAQLRSIDSQDNTETSTFDLTGNGLPEFVHATDNDGWCFHPIVIDTNTQKPVGFDPVEQCWDAPERTADAEDPAKYTVTSIRTIDGPGRIVTQTIDFNGDGRPDVLVGGTQNDTDLWFFHENTGEGFGPAIPVDLPPEHVGQTGSGGCGSADKPCNAIELDDKQDQGQWALYDMNGDGLPDLVVPEDATHNEVPLLSGESYWKVYLNTGAVRHGHGGSFTSAVRWKVEGAGGTLPNRTHVLTRADEREKHRRTTVSDLVDLTGDGLPDLVRRHVPGDGVSPTSQIPYRCDGQEIAGNFNQNSPGQGDPSQECWNLLLYVNTGSSFAPPRALPSPTNAVRAQYNDCKIGSQIACYDVMDFDGDGLADLVIGDRDQQKWRVVRNPASPQALAAGSAEPGASQTKPNLLIAVMNGLGAQTNLEYSPLTSEAKGAMPFPYWVVTEIDKSDSVSGNNPTTTYGYSGPKYSTSFREFYGFAAVRASDALGQSTLTEFYQDDLLKGSMKRRWTFGPVVAETCPLGSDGDTNPQNPCSPYHYLKNLEEFCWKELSGQCSWYNSAAVVSECPVVTRRASVLLREERSTPYQPASAESTGAPVPYPLQGRSTRYCHDAYGNETRRITVIGAGPSGEVVAKTDTGYTSQWNTSPPQGMPTEYLVGRPSDTFTIDSRDLIPDTEIGRKVSQQRFHYPTAGSTKLDWLETCLAWNDTNICDRWVRTSFTYDDWDNLSTTTDPTGVTSEIRYDDLSHQYPKATIEPGRIKTQWYIDPATGNARITVTPNGFRTDRHYDGLGRLLSTSMGVYDGTTAPQESPLVLRESLEYVVPAGGGVRVERRNYVLDEQGELAENGDLQVNFYDGFGRLRGTKTRTGTSSGPTNVVTKRQIFDDAGRLKLEAVPFPTTAAIDVLTEAIPSDRDIIYSYDELGFLSEKELPDGTLYLFDTSRPGVKLTQNPNFATSAPGSVSLELYDGLGRKTMTEQCASRPSLATAPLGGGSVCPAGDGLARMIYSFDALDRVTTVAQAGDPEDVDSPQNRVLLSETTYDGQGHVRTTFDYNAGSDGQASGLSKFTYDAAGRLTKVERPNGSETTNTYIRSSGRLRQSRTKYNGTEDRYTYAYGVGSENSTDDTFARGLLRKLRIRSKHGGGRQADVTKSFTYTMRGQVASEETSIVSSYYGYSDMVVGYRYDSADRPVDVLYPAVTTSGGTRDNTGAPLFEVARTHWNTFNQAEQLSVFNEQDNSSRSIVDNVEYDVFGHVVRVVHANGVRDHASYWEPDEYGGRLKCLRSRKGTGAPGCSDAFGTLDRLAVSFDEYDAEGNVRTINDPRSGAASDDHAIIYDSLSRVSQVTYADGEAEEYAYDEFGNIRTRRSIGFEPGLTTFQYGALHPHRLDSFAFQSDAFGSSPVLTTVEHDYSGNRISKDSLEYDYDGLDRLIGARLGNSIAEANLYDEGTNRIARHEPAPGEGRRHYLAGGLVEVAARDNTHDELVRYYSIAGRLVAREAVWAQNGSVFLSTAAAAAPAAKRRAASRDADAALLVGANWVLLCLLLTGGTYLVGTAGSFGGRVAGATAALLLWAVMPVPIGPRGPGSLSRRLAVSTAGATDPIATPTAGDRWFFHLDQLGSVQAVTKFDGALIDSVRYRAFGSERWSSGNVDRPRSFTGHVNDTQSGLLYMGARHYDTETGTFLTFDPAGQYPSPYAYGGNNPFAGTDPTGASFEISGSFSFDGMEAAGLGEFFKSGDLGANLGAAMRIAQVAARQAPQATVVNAGASRIHSPSTTVAEVAAGNGDSVVGTGIVNAQLLTDGRSEYRQSAASPDDSSDATATEGREPSTQSGKRAHVLDNPDQYKEIGYPNSVGKYECVAFPQAVAGAPRTTTWERGPSISPENPPARGTWVATFDAKGKYYGHVGAFDKFGKGGNLFLIDQFKGPNKVQQTEYRVKPPGWKGRISNDTRAYHVILW